MGRRERERDRERQRETETERETELLNSLFHTKLPIISLEIKIQISNNKFYTHVTEHFT